MTQESSPAWTFLTNHALVLLCIAKDYQARIREIAAQVGITERAVQRIIAELEEAGYLRHIRTGRRNQYEIVSDLSLRHPVDKEQTVGVLLELLSRAPSSASPRRTVTSGQALSARVAAEAPRKRERPPGSSTE